MSAQILQVTAGIALPEDIEMLFGSFGAGLVGSWIAMALYGLAVAQTYVYFVQYPQDTLWMKALVCSLESLSTLHAIFMAHAIYEIMTNAFSIVAIDATVWSLPASIAVRIVVNCVILLYFVKLCVQLSRRAIRWWLTATLVAPIFIYLAFGLDTVIRMTRTNEINDYDKFQHSTAVPMLAAQVGCDALITVVLCIILNKHKAGIRRTNTILNTLMVYAVNRGVLMFLVAMVELVLMTTQPQGSLKYVAAEFIVAGLYVNSLLAMINSRHSVNRVANEQSSASAGHSSSIAFRHPTDPSGDVRPVGQASVVFGGKTALRRSREDAVDVVDLQVQPAATGSLDDMSEKV